MTGVLTLKGIDASTAGAFDTHAVSVVLPLPAADSLSLDAHTAANLTFVVSSLLDAGADQILVADPHPTTRRDALACLLPDDARIQALPVGSASRCAGNAATINRAIEATKHPLLWVHDPDLFLDFATILPRIRSSERPAIKPFAWFVRFGDQDAARLRATGHLDPASFSGRGKMGKSFGKSSYLLARDLFIALGGLNERFEGPADEGFELVRRLRHYVRDIDELAGHGALMRRGLTGAAKLRFETNQALQRELAEAWDQDPRGYPGDNLSSPWPLDEERLAALSSRATRAHAFRVEAHHEPKVVPCALPGTMWGITTFFNPMRYRTKRENYRVFRRELARQGLALCTVEASYDGEYELDESDAERMIRVRATDVMWQKERLLNVALASLPDDCDKIAWLDCDVIFTNDDWVARAAAALERYVVVQPFALSTRLLPGERAADIADMPLGTGEHEVLHSMGYGLMAKGPSCLDRYLLHGHSGYAWTARRSLFARHGFYEGNILGNADLNMAHAIAGGPDAIRSETLSPRALDHLRRWAHGVYGETQGSLGFVPGLLLHLWHGNKDDRRYEKRLTMLVDEAYDPERDIRVDAAGALAWASDKPTLHRFVRSYFEGRNEDPISPVLSGRGLVDPSGQGC